MSLIEDTYTKARFFKCALQVNPASYIKYRGQEHQISESEYNSQLLNAAIEFGIKVIGLADHGSVSGIDDIRNLFNDNGIIVFPGFEIASSEKVHFVCLFDERISTHQLTMHLGALRINSNNPAAPVDLSASDIIKYVKDNEGFIFAAHCTNDDGVLKKRMNNIWRNSDLLAAQIPGSIEDLRGVEDDFYRKVFLNKIVDYSRTRMMTAINSADVSKPEEIKANGASCLVKMTKPSFSAFKLAFLDPESRIKLHSDKSENYASAIENIKLVSGYLDGVNINLSEHLNAVIGGRGTGKSTFLECIRYAFELEPFGKEAKAQHKAIIDNNLGNEKGLIEITIRSAAMNGRRFKIIRKYGDKSVVQDENGNITPYHPIDLFPKLELYGQNEIYEMTRDEQNRNKLVSRFLEDGHSEYNKSVDEVLDKLKLNRELIVLQVSKKNDIESEVEQLPKLLAQVKQYQDLGIDEKIEVISKLEKEKLLDRKVNNGLEKIRILTEDFKGSLLDTDILNDEALKDLPHHKILERERNLFDKLNSSISGHLNEINNLIEKAYEELQEAREEHHQEIGVKEEELDKTFKSIPTSQGKTGQQIGSEYQRLLREIESIKPKNEELENIISQLNALNEEREQLLLELSQKTSDRASQIQKAVKKLNRKLSKKVQLNLISEGDRQVLVEFLLNCDMEGVRERRLEWVGNQSFTPNNLVKTIRQGSDELIDKFSVSPTVASALCRISSNKLLELEEIIIPDKTTIELNVAFDNEGKDIDFRSIENLSTGQQCTAVLHLLLLDNQDPLILDQPEDNLDNAFIADRIVTELREAKLSRQFLFATHNANIPVFGDAEWIGVLSVEDNKGKILLEQQGAIDVPQVKELAAKILEGGQGAFDKRREKYGFD